MVPPNRLKELRLARGLRNWELCSLVQMSEATLSRWERGLIQTIPDSAKFKLAAFYGVPVAYLMGWDDDDKAAA